MLNRYSNLQRYRVLFVTGNYSGVLSRLHRRFTKLEIRRGFTAFQLMTILEEVCRILIIVEQMLNRPAAKQGSPCQQQLSCSTEGSQRQRSCGFITFRLTTILEEAHHTLIIIEHNLMLY